MIINTFHDKRFTLQSIESISFYELGLLFRAVKANDLKSVENLLKNSHKVQELEDALSFAAMLGHADIVQFLIHKGIDPNPNRSYNVIGDAWEERYTALGHAIENKHFLVVELLLNALNNVELVSREKNHPDSALDVFFSEHDREIHPDLLALLLRSGAKIHSLKPDTIFRIGVYANSVELKMLLDAGFDPKSIFWHESHPELKGSDSCLYIPEINLLDIAVIRAERANIFKEDLDSIEKVGLLVRRGANPFACNDESNRNYLHRVTHPSLIKLFGEVGVDVKIKARAYRYWDAELSPIQLAHTRNAVDLLCSYGEDIEKASFLPGTKAHNEALARIGSDEHDELSLIKAYKKRDIAAFVALIGSGVDVNKQKQSGWTVLHELFSKVSHGSVNDEYDYINISNDIEIRLINILIKQGASPLTDNVGRTPLMCLSFHPFNLCYYRKVIDIYIAFEASYYNLDPQEYREKFHKLRQGGYHPTGAVEVLLSMGRSTAEPIRSVFHQFWRSFEGHHKFDPGISHNPILEWNALKGML